MIVRSNLLKKSLALSTLGIVASLLIMLAVGMSTAQADRVTGRAVIGKITAVEGDTVTVSTNQGDFTLKLEEATRISAPQTRDAGMDALVANVGSRIAILADQNLVNDDGTPSSQAAAVRISIIHSKATREHRRVVVAEKRGEGEGTTVDVEGRSLDIQGVEESNVDDGGTQSGLPETGESAVLLVRPGAGNDQEDEVRAVVKTRTVVEWLNRLAGQLKTQNEDAFQSARIESLLDKHRDDVKNRLVLARGRAEEKFKDAIQKAEERAAKALETIRETRGAVSGIDADSAECVRRILGSVPARKADNPPGQFQRIEVQCLRGGDQQVEAKITAPRPGTTLLEGEDAEVRFETGELGEATIQLVINGEIQRSESLAGNARGLKFSVPFGDPIMTIELRAIGTGDDSGAIQKLLYDVRRDPPPRLRITSAAHDRELSPGSTISLGAQSEDNGSVVSMEMTVDGVVLASQRGVSRFTGLEYLVPVGARSLQVVATATDNNGSTTTVTREFGIIADPAPNIEIVSPSVGPVVTARTDFNIDVKAEDNGRVESVSGIITTGATTSRLAFSSISSGVSGTTWRAVAWVVEGTSSVKIEVTATDNAGNTATATGAWNVQTKADNPPSVKFTSPREGATVEEGSALKVEIQADDDGRVTGVEINWPTSGERVSATPSGGLWVAQITAPVLSGGSTSTQINSSIPPHVILGAVTIGGSGARDGTIVTAWIDGSSSTTTTLEARATDDGGNSSTTSVGLVLTGPQVKVGEGTVAGGTYQLLVSPFQGENFSGKTINFRVGGVAVSATVKWTQGGGTELSLRR